MVSFSSSSCASNMSCSGAYPRIVTCTVKPPRSHGGIWQSQGSSYALHSSSTHRRWQNCRPDLSSMLLACRKPSRASQLQWPAPSARQLDSSNKRHFPHCFNTWQKPSPAIQFQLPAQSQSSPESSSTTSVFLFRLCHSSSSSYIFARTSTLQLSNRASSSGNVKLSGLYPIPSKPTMRSVLTPSTKQSTHGRTWILSLVTRKGAFSTLTLMKRVSKCFGARA